jgi:cell division protein FtsZ
MADQVLYSGVACITDLMVKEGLINLDFADVRSVMREMGKAMMGTGEASGEGRAITAAEAAIANPLLDETSMKGAQGLLISITGGRDMTLFEVDEAATRIREEVDQDANIILGATFDESLEGIIRVSVVATGIEAEASVIGQPQPNFGRSSVSRRCRPRVRQCRHLRHRLHPFQCRKHRSRSQRAPQTASAPVAVKKPESDTVSEVIRETERDMASFEEQTAATIAKKSDAEPEFRPQSRLFQQPAAADGARPATAPIAEAKPPGRRSRKPNRRVCRVSRTFLPSCRPKSNRT